MPLYTYENYYQDEFGGSKPQYTKYLNGIRPEGFLKRLDHRLGVKKKLLLVCVAQNAMRPHTAIYILMATFWVFIQMSALSYANFRITFRIILG